jgi:hypothetical protein
LRQVANFPSPRPRAQCERERGATMAQRDNRRYVLQSS